MYTRDKKGSFFFNMCVQKHEKGKVVCSSFSVKKKKKTGESRKREKRLHNSENKAQPHKERKTCVRGVIKTRLEDQQQGFWWHQIKSEASQMGFSVTLEH